MLESFDTNRKIVEISLMNSSSLGGAFWCMLNHAWAGRVQMSVGSGFVVLFRLWSFFIHLCSACETSENILCK